MSEIIETRTIGSSGTSIGTHLLLESLFKKYIKLYDETREIPTVDIEKYRYHVYNLYTIVRNIVNSVTSTKEKENILLEPKFKEVLQLELANIVKYYKKTLCTPVLFYPDYSNVFIKFNVNKRPDSIAFYRQHEIITNKLKELDKKDKIISCNKGKGYRIVDLQGKLLITTHLSVDLHNNKSTIDLLESHTGKLYTKKDYNKRYHKVGREDITHLPFNEELHYILGDTTIVRPLCVVDRKEVVRISREFNWTPLTTREKVIDNIKRNPNICNILKDFERLYK